MTTNQTWWPDQLNLKTLRQNSPDSDPMGEDFDYAEAVKNLDVDALRKDIEEVMTTSQDWWPADYGHYGPLFIRMAWHAAGTYRISDGRGGGGLRPPAVRAPQQLAGQRQPRQGPSAALAGQAEVRPEPLLGRPARLYAGNCALESMGFRTFGFAFGRPDVWEADDTDWGSEEGEWLGERAPRRRRRAAGTPSAPTTWG